MTVIHGPKLPVSPAGGSMLKDLANQAKGMLGTAALREMETLLGVRFDPAPAYLFYVSISGLMVGLFTSCEGLRMTRQVEEVHEGGLNDHIHYLPGQISSGRVTLKRGISMSRELWNWFTEGLYDCKVQRFNMSIVQGAPGMSAAAVIGMDGPGIVKNWDLEGAYPVSWSLSNLEVSNTSQVAIESVEIVCSSLTLSKLAGTPMSPTALV